MRLKRAIIIGFAILATIDIGCSIYMHANRPVYKNIEVAQPGVERPTVIHELGLPKMSYQKDGMTTDVYELAPEAETQNTKRATTSFHWIADVLTLFMWEAVATPYELITAPEVKTYVITYNKEGKLDHMNIYPKGAPVAQG